MGTSSEQVVERALAEVAKMQAIRERHLAQRLEMQRKAAVVSFRPPVYILNKHGGQQIALSLEGGHAARDKSH